ncbi:ACP S-malonyltransferase [Pseudoduganella danionis]|uniref:Acyltransferase domain-containing protein n=1 Tax=Pseudoduganella danionis TaxID=1890295 RepID=A0ABW9SU58_9BURK|nr:acyltransferase domain-containing protein [Pseudoduganella danionis]MTW33869.1 acyltransferase domain-containing protein [Pseudoduganella danionis]
MSGNARLLLLCPGQGGQHAAMFDLARSDARASALLDNLALPSASELYANRHAQPLIVAATLAMWAAIRDHAPAPALVAGYSIGELAAYGVAGAYSPATTVQLATTRAELMDQAALSAPDQTLLAVSGMALARVQPLLQAHAYELAIETGEDSCIAGGPASQRAALEQLVAQHGGRCTHLPVAVASHTRYMQAAVAPFAALLQQTPFQPVQAPVLAGISAISVRDQATAVDQLARQLAAPIRWSACMDAAAEAGISYALELGPGSALSRMLQQRHPQISTRSVADFRTLDGILRWLERCSAA